MRKEVAGSIESSVSGRFCCLFISNTMLRNDLKQYMINVFSSFLKSAKQEIELE